jgi:hypothetical protein
VFGPGQGVGDGEEDYARQEEGDCWEGVAVVGLVPVLFKKMLELVGDFEGEFERCLLTRTSNILVDNRTSLSN